MRQLDEMQRRIQYEAWFFAAVGTVFLVTALSLVEATGVPWLGKMRHGLGWEGDVRSDVSSVLCGLCHRQPPLQMINQVREMRAAMEWSQSDLAEKLGVSRQTVNAIETGRYAPSLPLAFKLARLFKVAIEDIFVPDKD